MLQKNPNELFGQLVVAFSYLEEALTEVLGVKGQDSGTSVM